jgi:RNA polymerase sigma-70 factor (ECF subfamily)
MTGEVVQNFLLMADGAASGEASPSPSRADDHTAALVALAKAGDHAAFEQLMHGSERRVASTAWRLLGEREEARDATQETFLRAYKYLDGFKPGNDFDGWLYRITVNVCRDALRKRAAQGNALPPREGEPGEGRGPEPIAADTGAEEVAVLAQRRAIVARALATLPEKERTAVVLRDIEGRPTEEVARLMNTRPATVRSQISTGRTKIKLFYERLLRDARHGGDTK